MRWGLPCLAAAFLSAAAVPALACSCLCPRDTEAWLQKIPVVFVGRAISETPSGHLVRYEFRVTAVGKGKIPARVTVVTAGDSAACGVQFPLNRETMIGAHHGPLGMMANLCTQMCLDQRRLAVRFLLPLLPPVR